MENHPLLSDFIEQCSPVFYGLPDDERYQLAEEMSAIYPSNANCLVDAKLETTPWWLKDHECTIALFLKIEEIEGRSHHGGKRHDPYEALEKNWLNKAMIERQFSDLYLDPRYPHPPKE
jgi:hypothetical protein